MISPIPTAFCPKAFGVTQPNYTETIYIKLKCVKQEQISVAFIATYILNTLCSHKYVIQTSKGKRTITIKIMLKRLVTNFVSRYL